VEAEWAARRAERASGGGRIDAATISLADVQAALNDHTALIGWLDGAVGDSAGWAYVIRASGPVRWSRTGAAGGRSGEKGLRIAIADAAEWPARVPWSADVAEAAAALWNERLAPVMSDLESVDRVIVIPSGSMLGIPLEAALGPDGRFAGERFAVSYAPSATVYRMLVERGVRRATTEDDGARLVGAAILARDGKPADAAPFDRVTWRSALAGNADALDHLPPLPGSRFEVLRLAALLPHPRVLLGAEASEPALVELARSGQLSRFRILHVASHALVDDRAPDRSAVVLSRVGLPDALAAALRGERAYDGLWTAKEIVRECRLDADLVTLSGCRTGLGREAPGEGYLGLAHALFQAGARCLLVSLWAVDDRASALLMERFYTNLLRGERSEETSIRPASSKAVALRDAREWLRTYVDETGARPFEHPAYWAPFILIGDSR
jgi:CHAT domain-containing protein